MDDTPTTVTEPTSIEVDTELDATVDEAWHAVATPEGLAAWLAPTVELDAVAPGRAGRVVDDDGAARRLCVRDVEPGRRLTFTWWREDEPAEASTVTLLLVPAGPAVTILRVRETTALAGPRAMALTGALVRA